MASRCSAAGWIEPGLPAERGARRRSTDGQVLDAAARAEIVVEVPPGHAQVSPAKGVTHPEHRLQGDIRIAGAHIEVVRHQPLLIRAQPELAFEADDDIPDIGIDLLAARYRGRGDGTERSGEFPIQVLLHVGEPHAGQYVESGTRR